MANTGKGLFSPVEAFYKGNTAYCSSVETQKGSLRFFVQTLSLSDGDFFCSRMFFWSLRAYQWGCICIRLPDIFVYSFCSNCYISSIFPDKEIKEPRSYSVLCRRFLEVLHHSISNFFYYILEFSISIGINGKRSCRAFAIFYAIKVVSNFFRVKA